MTMNQIQYETSCHQRDIFGKFDTSIMTHLNILHFEFP